MRPICETMPEVIVLCSFRGFPIATTGSPTWTELRLPSGSGWSWLGRDALDLDHGNIGRLVGAEHLGVVRRSSPSKKVTFTEEAPRTTWALV